MTHTNDRLSINRRALLTAGTGMTMAIAAPAAAMALDTQEEPLQQQILSLINELESDHGSGLAAITWSRRHIANKLRTALALQIEDTTFDYDYVEYYKSTL